MKQALWLSALVIDHFEYMWAALFIPTVTVDIQHKGNCPFSNAKIRNRFTLCFIEYLIQTERPHTAGLEN